MTMTHISTYREKRLEGWRQFELYENTIVVSGKDYFVDEFVLTIPLHKLDPAISWIKTRTAGFWITAPLSFLISLPLYGLACFLLKGTEYLLAGYIGAGILAIYLTLGVIIRKIEFCNFHNSQGITILTVGCVGPDKGQYDNFVKLLREQIEKARQLSDGQAGKDFK